MLIIVIMRQLRKRGNLGAMNLRHDLNGTWQFNYAVNPRSRVVDFYKSTFDCARLGDDSSTWTHPTARFWETAVCKYNVPLGGA